MNHDVSQEFTLIPEVSYILYTLQKAGYEAALVGGAVRDLLLNIPTTDYDFTTNATPEQIQAVFPDSFYENQFGTVGVAQDTLREMMGISPATPSVGQETRQRIIDLAQATKLHSSLQSHLPAVDPVESQTKSKKQPIYEITTYRSEELYTQSYRKPDSLKWGNSLEEDLERRDFTINAMALTVDQEYLEQHLTAFESKIPASNCALHDPYNGQAALLDKKLSAVGDAHQRLEEDALRILRAVRFSVQLGFSLDDNLLQAAQNHANLIRQISWERIRDEFLKMLASSNPKTALLLLDQIGILEYLLPELVACKGVEQGGHHSTDVWEHSLDSVAACPSTDPIVRFATLLHDFGKPSTYSTTTGNITFYNHEIIGSRIAKKIARRFRLSKKDLDRMFLLVRHHMFYYQPENSDASIRRFMKKVGLINIDDILDLREGDRLGSGARKTSWRLEEMKARMIEQLHQPLEVTDLAINGNDLITELALKPGPLLGLVLTALLDLVLENPEHNTREELLKQAQTLIADQK